MHSNLKLELVQVIFRHGARVPDEAEYNHYKYLDASVYEPHAFGDLTNFGKQQEYEIGLSLRERYNDFLDGTYRSKDVYAHSSDTPRTKMSLGLVLAGLYPSTAETNWNNDLKWQPIPYSCVPKKLDIILRSFESPKFWILIKDALKLEELKRELAKFTDFVEFLKDKTGIDYSKHWNFAGRLYNLLACNEYLNLPLPEWYTSEVKEKLEENNDYGWNGMLHTQELKKLIGGPLVKTFIQNMNLDNTLNNPRKIYLYSGHDWNLFGVIKALGVDSKHPHFGSALILEKLTDPQNRIFVRLLSRTGSGEMKTLKLGNHEEFCPIEDFLKLTESIIPSEKEMNHLLDDLDATKLKDLFFEDTLVTSK